MEKKEESYMFVLVETDPLFSFVLQIYAALNCKGLFYNIGNKSVTNKFICNDEGEDHFNRPYDFRRTAAVTLRAFLIKALNLDRDAGVVFPATKTTPANLTNGFFEQSTLENFPTITNIEKDGKMIYSRFDQMLPHFVLDGATSPWTRHCLLIMKSGNSWKVFHIITTLMWNVGQPSSQWNASGRVTVVGATLKNDVKDDTSWKFLMALICNDISVDDILGGFPKLFSNLSLSNDEERKKTITPNDAVEQQLKALGLQRIKIPGDGNCLFHALCLLIGGYGSHDLLRQQIVEWITYKDHDLRKRIIGGLQEHETLDTFLRDLSKDGNCGGEEVIQAAANIFKIKISVIQPSGLTLEYYPSGQYGQHVYLVYDENLYDAAISVDGSPEEALSTMNAILDNKEKE